MLFLINILNFYDMYFMTHMDEVIRLNPFMNRDRLLQTETLPGVEGIPESPLSKEAVSHYYHHSQI